MGNAIKCVKSCLLRVTTRDVYNEDAILDTGTILVEDEEYSDDDHL